MIEHKKQWQFLKKSFETGQLSHAYLFSGPSNLGKKSFAENFIKFIGCKFPDIKIVSEENKKDEKFGDGGEIKISQIRDVQNFLSYKSYNGSFKAVIINEAEKMNLEAQSCFLKTLEEPKGNTVIILVSSRSEMLLPTIFSRCQQVKFFGNSVLSQEQAKQENKILEEILKVLRGDLFVKFKYVKSLDLEKQSIKTILEVIQKYFRHLLLLKTGIDKIESQKQFEETPEFFQKYSVIKLKHNLKLMENINEKIVFSNVNQKLALEILLIEL